MHTIHDARDSHLQSDMQSLMDRIKPMPNNEALAVVKPMRIQAGIDHRTIAFVMLKQLENTLH